MLLFVQPMGLNSYSASKSPFLVGLVDLRSQGKVKNGGMKFSLALMVEITVLFLPLFQLVTAPAYF
jgi:hypothetical protein